MSYFQSALAIYEQLGREVRRRRDAEPIAGSTATRTTGLAREMAEKARAMLAEEPPTVVSGYINNMHGIIEYALGNWQRAKRCSSSHCIGDVVGSDQLKKKALDEPRQHALEARRLGDGARVLPARTSSSPRPRAISGISSPAYNNVGVIEFGRGKFHARRGVLREELRIDEKIGALENEALALENLGEALEMVGKWDDAVEVL